MAWKDNIGVTEELAVEMVDCSAAKTTEEQIRELLDRLTPERAKEIIEAFRVELDK